MFLTEIISGTPPSTNVSLYYVAGKTEFLTDQKPLLWDHFVQGLAMFLLQFWRHLREAVTRRV
jgi:hypothetical protein